MAAPTSGSRTYRRLDEEHTQPVDQASANDAAARRAGRLRVAKWCGASAAALSACLGPSSWYVCSQAAALSPDGSQAAALIDSRLHGSRYYLENNLPVRRSEDALEECRRRVPNRTVLHGLEYGRASAAEGPLLAYQCTKVPGLFERVPEVLRGVFWMKGNAISEELAVLQYGQWVEEDLTMLTPFAPFMWAWADGRPQGAPYLGHFYREEKRDQAAYGMPSVRPSYSLKFQPCPGSARLPPPVALPGHVCGRGHQGANASELAYATLQSHTFGDLRRISQEETYSIEAMSGEAQRGSKWYRGIYGGPSWLGGCKCISIGSYELTKIVDGSGQPLEPYYSEFVKYMGDVPIRFWLGQADSGDDPWWGAEQDDNRTDRVVRDDEP